jgi:tetratricopeptide (TPR) repeat protein
MLYSLLPPILVILSFIGIIVFLVKKSSKVAEIKEEEIAGIDPVGNAEAKEGGFRKIFNKDRLKNASLSALEKLSRKVRMIFLKLENLFQKWSESIRKRRSTRVIGEKPVEPSIEKRKMLNRLASMKKGEWKKNKKHGVEHSLGPVFSENEEEKVIKPIISDKVVSPRTKTEIKDRLEDLLIERIALNSKDVEAYERLGEYYMNIGSHDYAKECLKQVLKLDPANKNAKFKMKSLENMIRKR